MYACCDGDAAEVVCAMPGVCDASRAPLLPLLFCACSCSLCFVGMPSWPCSGGSVAATADADSRPNLLGVVRRCFCSAATAGRGIAQGGVGAFCM